MKDFGKLKYMLGIEVLRSNEGIFISQRKYILDLLAETDIVGCKPAEIEIIANHGLRMIEGEKLANRGQYQRMVGKLIYLSIRDQINRHFINEKLENKIISLPFVRSKDQLTDILTKVVTSEAFEQILCKLGIDDPKT